MGCFKVYERVFDADNADGNAAGAVARQVIELLTGKRAGLVTDIDGTISPIVARPEEAIVLPNARQALAGLSRLIEVVAVVTGRGVADARQMVGVDGLTYIGNHGLETWHNGRAETLPDAQPWAPIVAAVLDDVAMRITGLHGVIAENKGATASLHYRLADDPAEMRRLLLEILARTAVPKRLRIEEGRMVINLLPPLTISKGSAVTWLAHEHYLQSLVFFGDDNTDAHAFLALKALRETQGVNTLAIGVVGAETPPSVRHLADATLPSVTAVADLLWEVFEALKSSDTMKPGAPTVGSE